MGFAHPPPGPRAFALGIALSVSLFGAGPLFGVVRYVAATGSDATSCTSSASPCLTIQKAVDSAASGDEIRVAQGTYSGSGNCAAIQANAVVCILNKQITLRGGFSTADWLDPNPSAHPTVIDGQNLRSGIVVEKTSPTAPAASLVLEGFEIRNGHGAPRMAGAGDALTFGWGGGIDASASPLTLRDVVLADNRVIGSPSAGDYAGAASGGGLSARSSPSQPKPAIQLERVQFLRNVADAGDNTGATGRGGYGHGGGLYTYFVDLNGSDLLFEDNQALGGSAPSSDGRSVSGERGDGLGGAISIEFGSSVTLANVVATGNFSRGGDASPSNSSAVAGGGFGGVIQIEGSPSQPSSLTLSDSDLVQNSTRGGDAWEGGLGRGGGILMNDAQVTLDRVLLLANQSTGGDGNASGSGGCSAGEGRRGAADGGGATLGRYLGSPVVVTVRNSIVADNATRMGTTGCEPGGGGGGISLDGVQATFEHLTLARNSIGPTSMQGSGLVLLGTVAGCQLDLDYGIVADHDTPPSASAVHAQSAAAVTFTRGLFAGNSDDTNAGQGGAGSFTGLGTTITAATAGFVAPGPPGYDYHLAAGSAAVGQAVGSPISIDFEQQSRDGSPDLGADELGRPDAIFSDDFEAGTLCGWSFPC